MWTFMGGMAIGMVVAIIFGMTLVVIISSVKREDSAINADLRQFWSVSLRQQRDQVVALRDISSQFKRITLEELNKEDV